MASPSVELVEAMDAMSEYRAAKWYRKALMHVAFEQPEAVVRALAMVGQSIEKDRAEKAPSSNTSDRPGRCRAFRRKQGSGW